MIKNNKNTHSHLILKANSKGRDFVSSDIHGCYDELMENLERVKFDFNRDRLLALGDMIDRGKKSLTCLQLLEQKWFHSILGNHEQMMMDYLFRTRNKYFWYFNGGDWHTHLSPEDKDEVMRLCQRYVTSLPHSMTIELADGVRVGLVHAEPPEDWTEVMDEYADLESLIWARGRIKYKFETPVQNIDLVLVGHTADNEIRQLGNVIYLDTGAGYSLGKLTVIELASFVRETLKKT